MKGVPTQNTPQLRTTISLSSAARQWVSPPDRETCVSTTVYSIRSRSRIPALGYQKESDSRYTMLNQTMGVHIMGKWMNPKTQQSWQDNEDHFLFHEQKVLELGIVMFCVFCGSWEHTAHTRCTPSLCWLVVRLVGKKWSSWNKTVSVKCACMAELGFLCQWRRMPLGWAGLVKGELREEMCQELVAEGSELSSFILHLLRSYSHQKDF